MKGGKRAAVSYALPDRGRAQADDDHQTQPMALVRGDLGVTGMEKLWSTQELADFLGLPVQTIYQWRKREYGPPGRKMGKHIRYRRSEVECWIDSLDGRAA